MLFLYLTKNASYRKQIARPRVQSNLDEFQ